MDVSLFDYDLPQDLIAQFPVRTREQSRLLVLDRSIDSLKHRKFRHVLDHIRPGDALVVNNTKVFKARLFARRPTGGRVEVFLIRPDESADEVWIALVTPSRRVKVGERLVFDDTLHAILTEDSGRGFWRVAFSSRTARERIISRFGHVPLPPYINRDDQPSDIRRYQTVFASNDKSGAVAAPTAGFHFTRPILKSLEQKGVSVIELTLHVGPGTFKPIKVDDIADHVVDPEVAELTPEAAERLNQIREKGGKIFAVGTTSVRTLESAPIKNGMIQPFSRMVDLYIKPGYKFRVIDHLITNFHLPKSSLLVLVSAFAGRETIMSAYREAVLDKYRFYSYGDAMLIL